MNDKLDLLGVRYDAEMEIKAKYKLAKNLYEFWSEKCEKFDDFKNNCLISICYELRTNDVEEISEIWEMIEEQFFVNYNLKDVKNKGNHMLLKGKGDNWTYDIVFDDIYSNEWYTVIDKQLMGEKLKKELLKEYDFNHFYDETNDEFSDEFIKIILTKIEEKITDKLKNEICDFVFQ